MLFLAGWGIWFWILFGLMAALAVPYIFYFEIATRIPSPVFREVTIRRGLCLLDFGVFGHLVGFVSYGHSSRPSFYFFRLAKGRPYM